MTEKELQEMGFMVSSHKHITHITTHIIFRMPADTLKKVKKEALIDEFYNAVYEEGKKEGRKQKIKEIERVLQSW